MKKDENRGNVLALVFEQIQKDVYVEDFTAIAQMLKGVKTEDLAEYLSEDKKNELSYVTYYDCQDCGSSYREGELKRLGLGEKCSCGTKLSKNKVYD